MANVLRGVKKLIVLGFCNDGWAQSRFYALVPASRHMEEWQVTLLPTFIPIYLLPIIAVKIRLHKRLSL